MPIENDLLAYCEPSEGPSRFDRTDAFMTKTITSRSNPLYRKGIGLRKSRSRKRSGEFLIDGSRDLDRAIASGVEPSAVFVSSNAEVNESTERPAWSRVIQWADAHNCLCRVAPGLYPALCYGQRESDVVAIATAKETEFDQITLSQDSTIVVLDRVEKPGNVGAVVRSADASGATGIILTGGSTDPFNPNSIRASSGAVFQLPVVQSETQDAIDWLAANGFAIILARVDATQTLWDLQLTGRTAIVLGNEADGLGSDWAQAPADSFHIPMHGISDSLNVSVTSAIVLFEASRQKFNAAESMLAGE